MFVAEEADFQAFESWTSFNLPTDDPLSGVVYPPGARVAFLNARPDQGATRYPSGTIIVKEVQRDALPQDWEIFAVAKRGGSYNAAGAVGWEFFFLTLDADRRPRIASRGITPGDDGHGDMSFPNGGGYTSGGTVVPCNLCHGDSRHAGTDHILSPLLAPAATAQP